jgi:hypothetical protein
MMVQEDESLTIRDVGRMISINNISTLTDVIAALITDAMPETEGEPEAGDNPLAVPSSAPESGGLDTGQQQSSTSE